MELTEVDIRQGLEQFFDRKAGQDHPRAFDITRLGAGFEADVFAFSAAAIGEDPESVQDLVLRLYARDGAAEKSLREFTVMDRLRKAGYPTPKVIAVQSDGALFGRPFLIMERIHGVSLGASYWSGVEDRRAGAAAMLWPLIARLHTLEAREILPDAPQADAGAPYACVERELAELSGLLDRFEGREPPSLREAVRWLTSRRTTVPCERASVIHGDFHPNNVLVRTDGAPFVIDWSNVHLGDYRSDLAWTRLITTAEAQPDGGAAELHLYERLVGKEVVNLAYFEVAACTRLLLSVLLSLQFGAPRQGMRPEAEALMRAGDEHMKYTAALLQKRMESELPDLENTLSAL